MDYVTEFHWLSGKINDTEKVKVYKFVRGLHLPMANEVVQ